MNNKKGRATRKRCVRKCKKRTSRKLHGSRRYGGGMKGGSHSVKRIKTNYVKSLNPNNPIRSTISKRPDRDVYDRRRIEEAPRENKTDGIENDNELYKQPLVNDTSLPPPQ